MNESVHATFDRPTAPPRETSLRHLVVAFTPPAAAPAREPTPLDLALVIDASGSMAGAPLRAAIDAACGVVERLGENDRLSVVSFASDVQTHLRAEPMNEFGRFSALKALRSLDTRGRTNLSGGWLAGAECVAQQMERDPAARHHVVVLSDGHANEGICKPGELARHAAALRDRGLLSSAVGVGAGYSTTQLAAISEHGGGRLHHAADPGEIAAVVLGELDDVRTAIVHDLVLDIQVPAGVRAEVADACPVRPDGGRLRCELGSVLAGTPRRLVVSCLVPVLECGNRPVFDIHASWRSPDHEARETLTTSATLAITHEPANRDVDASLHAARAWLAVIERGLVDWNREGLYGDARRYLDAQRGPFEEHCCDLPGGPELIDALHRAARLAREPVPEPIRKEVHIAAYKSMKGEIDKRRM